MGWEKHQAVYVGHNDTEHRHLHIILNRVDHETGRTLDDYKERKRSQVWALAYEKQHETIRCEERELRAAKREGRTPDLEPTRQSPEKDASKEATASPAPLQPANDHLPHNVIMLARPEELAFKAHEMAREEFDKNLRGQLKAEQRAEREAFFKDGAKQFKATRHAVYDEVRKEYAPEWKQFYKDADAARHSAEAWSHSAVSRAMYFGKDGRWDEARSAFDDRDAVREVVAKEFSERKGDLKSRQNDDLRERQRDACDVLRDARDAERGGPGRSDSFSASLGGASAGVRLPSGWAAPSLRKAG